ncbi:unnamed protein product [Rhizophagus irregularis]|nr:unnamed protein product [Rhizophagus irregularis]
MLSKKIKRKSANGFSFFYKFSRNILKREHPNSSPREKMIRAARLWSASPNEVKNSFKRYAEDDNALMTFDSKVTKPAIIMFDRDDRDEEFNRLFDELISEDMLI